MRVLSVCVLTLSLVSLQHSENSSNGSGSRSDSRNSARSSDSYDTLRMSSLFVHKIASSSPAEHAGLQIGWLMCIVHVHNMYCFNTVSQKYISKIFFACMCIIYV